MRHTLLLAIVLAGCKSKPSTTTTQDAAPIASDATAPIASTTSAPSASGKVVTSWPVLPATHTPTPARDSPAEGPPQTHVIIGVDDGAIELWTKSATTPHGEGTTIFAQSLDALGSPRGAPQILRTTSGTVVALSAARASGELWFGWTSQITTSGTTFFAIARTDVALAKVAAPTTLMQVKSSDVGGEADVPSRSIRLAPRADKSGVVVATLGPSGTTKCFLPQRGASCKGLGWLVFAVDASNGVKLLAGHFVDGGPSVTLAGLLDRGDAVIASAWAWHGGVVTDHVVIPWSGGVETTTLVPIARPPYTVSWNGQAVVTHAHAHYWDEKNGPCPTAPGKDMCEQVAIARAGSATLSALTTRRETCSAGHATLELVTSAGSVKLSTANGTVPELAGWTGKALLTVDEEGRVTKRVCERGTIGAPRFRE